MCRAVRFDESLERLPTAEELALLATASLKDEANLFPKPGLVNWRSSGSHTDMTIEMMHASVDAISSSFKAMADAAKKADRNNPESLSALRMTVGAIGRAAEVAMLKATGGVNTHRGAIYAQGLLTVAAGLRSSCRACCSTCGPHCFDSGPGVRGTRNKPRSCRPKALRTSWSQGRGAKRF